MITVSYKHMKKTPEFHEILKFYEIFKNSVFKLMCPSIVLWV